MLTLKMSTFDRAHMTSLSHVASEIFSVGKYRELEVPARSQSRSSKVVPFVGLDIVSHESYIVTLSLRCTVFEIYDFKSAVTLKTGLVVRQGH